MEVIILIHVFPILFLLMIESHFLLLNRHRYILALSPLLFSSCFFSSSFSFFSKFIIVIIISYYHPIPSPSLFPLHHHHHHHLCQVANLALVASRLSVYYPVLPCARLAATCLRVTSGESAFTCLYWSGLLACFAACLVARLLARLVLSLSPASCQFFGCIIFFFFFF